MSVKKIAENFSRSRARIYAILQKAGIDTTLGQVLRPRKDTKLNRYLDTIWTEDVGRSPSAVAQILGIKTSTVVAALRNRRDSLAAKIERLPIANMVAYGVDPYTMTVIVTINKNGESHDVTLTEESIIRRLKKLQTSHS